MSAPRETICKTHDRSCVKRRCKAYHAEYMRAWRKKQRELLLAYRSVIEGARRTV